MSPLDVGPRRAEAVAEFEAHEHRSDGTQVVRSLFDGLSLLRDSFFERVHSDVEQSFGTDSTVIDAMVLKNEANADTEIEIYSIVESALDAVRIGCVSRPDNGSAADKWFSDWLGRLRLGEEFATPAVSQRLAY